MDEKAHNEQSGTVGGHSFQVHSNEGGIHLHRDATLRDAPPRAVPRQLPAALPHFVGRADELAALAAMRESGSRVVLISAVEGVTGIGKSTLAVRWAHEIAQEFPDGQFHVDMRGSSGLPLRPGDILRQFLAELGEQDVPHDMAAKVARYRTLLAEKRVLIVLDDAQDVEQVRPLLPAGAHCLTVITSRRQLTGLIAAEGAQALTLDVLSDSEARDLLARHLDVRRDPEGVNALIERCGRVPLALSAVATAMRPELSFADVVTELPADGSLSSKVQAALDWSRRNDTEPTPKIPELTWVRDLRLLFAAAVAVAATTLVVSTRMISESGFVGLAYFLIRFAMLFGGLALMSGSQWRRSVGVGLITASTTYFVVDALVSMNASASLEVWLEFLSVATFAVLFAIRLWPFTAVPRRPRIIPPAQRPFAWVVLAGVVGQLVIIFAAVEGVTIVDGAGALAALLPVVVLGGLCTAVALVEVQNQSQRLFAISAVAGYFGPELFLMIGSVLLGEQFTYFGGGIYMTGISATGFVLVHAVITATLLGSTALLVRPSRA